MTPDLHALADRAATALADLVFAALGWLLGHGLDLLGTGA